MKVGGSNVLNRCLCLSGAQKTHRVRLCTDVMFGVVLPLLKHILMFLCILLFFNLILLLLH